MGQPGWQLQCLTTIPHAILQVDIANKRPAVAAHHSLGLSQADLRLRLDSINAFHTGHPATIGPVREQQVLFFVHQDPPVHLAPYSSGAPSRSLLMSSGSTMATTLACMSLRRAC